MSGDGSVNHSLNSSTSKNRYSFGKANRFLPPLQPICDKYYDVTDVGKPRTTSFGIGDKLAKLRMNDAPSPDHYRILTEFEEEVALKRKGFSFGYGRQLIGGPMEEVRLHRDIPGPGMYPTPSSLKSCNITLKPRLPDKSLATLGDIPGPGTYQLPAAITKDGRHPSSQYVNARCPKIISPKERNTIVQSALTPGPGQCTLVVISDNSKLELNPEGRYFSSKFDNSKVRSFSKGRRGTLANEHSKDIPGPGSQYCIGLCSKLFSPFDS